MAAATTMTEKMGGTTMGGFITAVGTVGKMGVGATTVPTTPPMVGPVMTCSIEGIQSRAGSSGERVHRETRDRATTTCMHC